jgi:hypothetical protein
MTIAALYVHHGGVYYGLDGVEPWGIPERDAREYDGPWPVVAHPPCKRWGRYWFGGPSARVRRILGDDDGCFAAAIDTVRKRGGILEHPEGSHAWSHFGLIKPPKKGGWVAAGDFIGWTCCVEQGHYGHRARKATWLYVVGPSSLPSLIWGKANGKDRMDDGFHSKEQARAARSAPGYKPIKRLSAYERLATPIPFRDLLISIAKSCHAPTD